MTRLWSPRLADDLEAFVMFVYPWGQPNTPLATKTGPRKWQRQVLRDITAHIKANKGKLPKIDVKPKKDPSRHPKRVKKVTLKSFAVDTVKVMEADIQAILMPGF